MRISLRTFLIFVGCVCVICSLTVQWHVRSSAQLRELTSIRQDPFGSDRYWPDVWVYLEDEVAKSDPNELFNTIFVGPKTATTKWFGIEFDRDYLLDATLVVVFRTSPKLADRVRQLKNVKQIHVMDHESTSAVSKWQEWFPDVIVVTPSGVKHSQD